MKYEKYKLFWKTNDCKKDIQLISFDEESQDYYSFIKKCISDNLHQISLTAEIMLGYIAIISRVESIAIEKIELMEDDSEENEELNNLIELSRTNRGLFVDLLNRLRYLEDESSIEIKRVYFKEKTNNQKSELFYIQVNGLIGSTSREVPALNRLVEYLKETFNE